MEFFYIIINTFKEDIIIAWIVRRIILSLQKKETMEQSKKDNIESILLDLDGILQRNAQIDSDIDVLNKRVDHRIYICEHTRDILDAATKEFNGLTSILNKKDIPFFIFSILLQCSIKYVIKKLREMSDKKIADKIPGHNPEHSARHGNKYYASREEIITNPVPFDAILKEHENRWYKDNNEIRPGFNGFNHRTKALGHDPLLGLIFGTANIMTSTITRNDFVSWHVNTLAHSRTAKNGIEYFAYLDTICERASTIEIFSQIINRLKEEGKEGWMTLGCALLKEIVHLFTDIPSQKSLPIPVVPVFSEKMARTLSFYGLNTGTIVQGGFATMLINWLIGFLHKLCMNAKEDGQLYQVRTQKIIMYSNIFATVSDLGYTMLKAYLGDKNAMAKFDLGGYIVTLYQISHSSSVISAVEREFYTKKIIDELNNYVVL